MRVTCPKWWAFKRLEHLGQRSVPSFIPNQQAPFPIYDYSFKKNGCTVRASRFFSLFYIFQMNLDISNVHSLMTTKTNWLWNVILQLILFCNEQHQDDDLVDDSHLSVNFWWKIFASTFATLPWIGSLSLTTFVA